MSREIARTALTPIVWGSTYIVATEFLPADRPLLAATARALPVGLIFVLWRRRLPEGSWWWRSAVLGALNIGAFFALLFIAAYRLPGGVAATAGSLQPLIASALGAVLLGEVFRRGFAVGGLMAVAGVALLVLGPNAALDPLGVLAAVAASFSMATGVVLTKKWGRPVDLVTFTGWQLTAGGLGLLPLLILVEGLPSGPTAVNVVGFVWLGVVGTGAAYANWFRGVQRLPVATIGFLGLFSPLTAAVLGWAVLGEGFSPVQVAGAALVLSAVLVAQRAPVSALHRRHRSFAWAGGSPRDENRRNRHGAELPDAFRVAVDHGEGAVS